MNSPILPCFFKKALLALSLLLSLGSPAAKADVFCPEDQVIQLGTYACGMIVALHELDFTTTVPLVDTVFFPETNSTFPIGTTTVTMATADIDGQLSACTFQVTVLDFLGQEVYCQPTVALSLGGDCEHVVTAEEVLFLELNGCPDNFTLFRLGQNGALEAPVVTAFDIGATVTIRARQNLTGEECDALVTVLGGTPPSITCPPNIIIACNLPVDTAFTGAPLLDGCFDNVMLSYTDQLTPTNCPDSFAYQIIRQWTAVDPYGHVDQCSHIITAKKFDISLVTFPPDRDGVESPAVLCNDSLDWEMVADPDSTGFPVYNGYSPNLSQFCRLSVTYLDFETQLCGASWEIRRVWKVVKTCAPFVTVLDTQIIKILDPNPPLFELPDSIFVSLAPECDSFVHLPPAQVISECSDYHIVLETPWDTLTTNGGSIHFDTLIAGVYPIKYTLTDVCGNTSTQEPLLIINNGTLVTCPPDTSVNCDFFNDTLNVALQIGNLQTAEYVGNPTYYANCIYPVSEVDSFDINSCGVGTVKRYLTNASATEPVTCVQTITVTPVSDFEVLFPADVAICTTLAAGNTGQPILYNISCENVSINSTDDITLSGTAGCFTVHRTFVVKNTCTYNGDSSIPDEEVALRRFADGGDGYIEYTQVIEVNNTAGPTFPFGCNINDINLPAGECTASFIIPTPISSGCGGNPTVQVSGDLGNTIGATIPLFPGAYNIVFTATDDCGKTGTCTASFEVFDTQAPIAKCKSPFTIEPMTELAPLDLDNGSDDNCSGLYYSFAKDSLAESWYFPCCQDGLYDLTLWVTDQVGNMDSCHTFVLVDADTTSCICDLSLSGHIFTEDNEGVANVIVSVATGSMQDTLVTDATGTFSFNVLPGEDYSLNVYKNTNPLNGVTTFDGVLITRHILGIAPLDSPYKIIGADINRSNTVTTFDMVELRRVILGINQNFTNNTSWRFVPADFVFPNPLNPFQSAFPEIINLNNLQGSMANLYFIAIKIGDMNGSVDPTMLTGKPKERDALGSIPLSMPDLLLKKGQHYSLPLNINGSVTGFQFALLFDKGAIALESLEPSLGTGENYLVEEGAGRVKASWIAPGLKETGPSATLFLLHFLAKKDGPVRDMVQIDLNAMPHEAYSPGLDIQHLALSFEQWESAPTLELFPARPNPFNESTQISFKLPQAGLVKLSVTDLAGKTVWEKRQVLGQGMHDLELKKGDLPGEGAYIFKLETPGGSKTTKLVLSK
jgi:hypothetical protein